MRVDELERLLRSHFAEGEVRVWDMTGTSDHFQIEVRSELFRGKSLVEQHRLVHEALGSHLEGAIHAVKIKTRAP